MYCSFISHSAKRLSSVVGTARCIRQKESGHCASSSYRGSPRVFVRMHYIILFYIFAILVPWQGILIWRAFPNTHTHLVHTNPSGMAWHVYDRKPIWRRIHVQKEMWSIVGCNANCRVWEGKRENLCECFFTAIKWVFCHSLSLSLYLSSLTLDNGMAIAYDFGYCTELAFMKTKYSREDGVKKIGPVFFLPCHPLNGRQGAVAVGSSLSIPVACCTPSYSSYNIQIQISTFFGEMVHTEEKGFFHRSRLHWNYGNAGIV